MTCRFLIGDVHERLAEIPDGSVDFLVTSPPFLALRSYLPAGHPDKAKEIGSEPTPATFIDVLLALTAEWGRVLAPHGSIAVELGDTYAGSGGGGGDYQADGMRSGQPTFDGSGRRVRETRREGYIVNGVAPPARRDISDGWPLAKSLACIPQLYQVGLAYGRNVLRAPLSARELLDVCEQWATDTPELTVPDMLAMMRQWIENYEQIGPAREYERWRVRNLKPWIRSNPPVGALGDKERPATSYVVVACRASDRWFDLDAVRTTPLPHTLRYDGERGGGVKKGNPDRMDAGLIGAGGHAGGAPPRDWWHHVDAVLDAELAARAGKPNGGTGDRNGKETHAGRGGGWSTFTDGGGHEDRNTSFGAQGVHLRRALEKAGILTTLEALDVSPRGYSGAHYAVWPPELVRLLIDEMCPQRVCLTCGQPSRRIHDLNPDYNGRAGGPNHNNEQQGASLQGFSHVAYPPTKFVPVGWSDCGHNTWRPGHVLDPFAGSGTTLAVATGMGRTATGIDIDERNADLARQRCGMFLDIDAREVSA